MNCPKCGKEQTTTACGCWQESWTIPPTALPSMPLLGFAEQAALLARAEKAEAACAAWREAYKASLGGDKVPLILCAATSPSPGSDLLERLRRAEQDAGLGLGLNRTLVKESDALRAENERLKAARPSADLIVDWAALKAENERLRGQLEYALDAVGALADVPDERAVPPARIFCGSHGKRLPCGECNADNAVTADNGPNTSFTLGGQTKWVGNPPPGWWFAEDQSKLFAPPDKAPRRPLWPLALAAVAAWTFIALRFGWFSSAWAWWVEVMG